MVEFAKNFVYNQVLKPSVQVLKKVVQDGNFMKQKEVFDSELDAAVYPLPLFTYTIVKIL